MKILVVEDDVNIQKPVVKALQEEGYEVDAASTGDEGLWLAETSTYDVAILDIMLPGVNGLDIGRRIRDMSAGSALIFATARDAVEDRVHGLDLGADDYIVKPFAIVELLARVRAALRSRGALGDKSDLTFGQLELDRHQHAVTANGKMVTLSGTEYDLLEFMMLNKRRILTREQLFERVWGFDSDASSAVIDVYIHYLRKKLSLLDCDAYIATKRGIGFRLEAKS